MNNFPEKNRGIALITAILAVSIATVLAVSMVSRQQRDIHKTENILRLEQAWLLVHGIDAWAIGALDRDKQKNTTDSAADYWNIPIKQTAVSGGELAANIHDMQGRFNINNLRGDQGVDKLELARFQRLLKLHDLSPDLIDAVIDWMDSDSEVRYPNGAEDMTYNNASPPYRTANVPMVHPSELLAVDGMTQDAYELLIPYVVTLPERIAINVNTAPEHILMILADGFSEADAQAIISTRTEAPFESIKRFLEHPALAGLEITEEGLTTSSSYFQVNGDVRHGHLVLGYQSVIKRSNTGRSRVIQRVRRGVFNE
ncbi:type II secretion system minor pseudopilin GspK [Sedimenticola hydrogenitrophicus]|uniref:type II secretion system minor pseudopilin GspK n=1 Tax=Sedimenticola hydrogenitrophicus TaxID=2967975 RepID=UPI0023AE9974|nr:type II secretion system minor pseudopilin GspK [Sedimenticola hydrogenitrophicus]